MAYGGNTVKLCFQLILGFSWTERNYFCCHHFIQQNISASYHSPEDHDLNNSVVSCLKAVTAKLMFMPSNCLLQTALHLPSHIDHSGSSNSAVGIVTDYGLEDTVVGIGVPTGSRTFSSPCRPGRLWGPPSLLSNGY
jgi:hypothetical protein